MTKDGLSISLPPLPNNEFGKEYYAILFIGATTRLWNVGTSVEDVKSRALERINGLNSARYKLTAKKAIKSLGLGDSTLLYNVSMGKLHLLKCDDRTYIYTHMFGRNAIKYIFDKNDRGETIIRYFKLKAGVLKYYGREYRSE